MKTYVRSIAPRCAEAVYQEITKRAVYHRRETWEDSIKAVVNKLQSRYPDEDLEGETRWRMKRMYGYQKSE